MKTDRTPLPPELMARVDALDGAPNTDDIPETFVENWMNSRRFYRVRKQPISIRVAADVLDWLRGKRELYQVEIYRILRERMTAEIAK